MVPKGGLDLTAHANSHANNELLLSLEAANTYLQSHLCSLVSLVSLVLINNRHQTDTKNTEKTRGSALGNQTNYERWNKLQRLRKQRERDEGIAQSERATPSVKRLLLIVRRYC